MKRILSILLTFSMMFSIIGGITLINTEEVYARYGGEDQRKIYQPTDDPVYYYQPPVDENGNHDYFGYKMYEDPNDITDEEFFGRWDEVINTWVLEPYFNYSDYPDLALVEQAAKSGDYPTAKKELQNYYKNMTYKIGSITGFHPNAHEYLEALSRNVFSYDYTSMTSNGGFEVKAGEWGKSEIDVLSIINNAKKGSYTDLNMMFASADKFWTTAQIYSRDAADPSVRPVLRMVVNGRVTERYPNKDTMVVAGGLSDINYGYDEIIEIQEHGTYDDIGEPYGSYDSNTKRAFMCFDISDLKSSDTVASAKIILTSRSIITDETRAKFPDEYGEPYSGEARDKTLWSMWYRFSAWKEGELTWGSEDIADKFYFSCNDMNAWDYITSNSTRIKGKVCDYHRGSHQDRLCDAYYILGDERYAYTLIRQEMAMINSIGHEPGIYNALDRSNYVLTLTKTMYALIDSKYMTPEVFTTFLKHLWLLTDYTVEYYYGTSLNNWGTYATSSVYKMLAFFPEFERHDHWYQRTLEDNDRLLAGVVYEDGHCVEVSQGYIGTILTTFEEPLKVYTNVNHPGPYSEELYQHIHDIVKNGVYSSGGPDWAGFNIADTGDISGSGRRSVYVNWYYLLFNDDEELRYIATNGLNGKMSENPTTHYPVTLRTFMRSSWDGYTALQMSFVNTSDVDASHYHNDCLSIAMYAYGKYLLSDQGYGSDQTGDGGRVWDYNKSPVQHNLMTINDVYDYLNDGICYYTKLERNSTWEKDFESNKAYDFIEYVCDGYSTAQTMQRSVTFMKDQKFWIVTDYGRPNKPENENLFAQHWHMAPGANITNDEMYILRSNYADINVMIVPLEHEEIDEVLYQDTLFGGTTGQKILNKKAVLTKSKTGDARFTTLVIPVNVDENFEVTSRVLTNKNETIDDDLLNMVYFKITETNSGASSYYYYYHINDASKKPADGVKVGNYVTDATTMVMQLNENDEMVSLFVTDASYITDETRYGEYLYKSPEPTSISFTRHGVFVNVVSSLITEVADLEDVELYLPIAKAARYDGDDVAIEIEDGLITFKGTYGSSNITSGAGGGGYSPSKKDEEDEPTTNPDEPVNPVVPTPTVMAYNDVNDSDWFYNNVKFVYDNKLMNGITDKEFSPLQNLTRAMLVTILYRAEGEPEVEGENTFEDIKSGSYYEKAVQWAMSKGIVGGYSEKTFGPDDNITREQISAIMYRYANYKEYDVELEENIKNYDDAEEVSEYAVRSMKYAVASGLLKGKTETTLNPLDKATRAEIAAILQRFFESNK